MKEEEKWLQRIPVLGYFFRKTEENREVLERTLKTGKEPQGEIKKRTFLCGLFGISLGKKFNTLKSRKND